MKKTNSKIALMLLLLVLGMIFNPNMVKATEKGSYEQPYESIDEAFGAFAKELEDRGIGISNNTVQMNSFYQLWVAHDMVSVYAKNENGEIVEIESKNYKVLMDFRDDYDRVITVNTNAFSTIEITEKDFEYSRYYILDRIRFIGSDNHIYECSKDDYNWAKCSFRIGDKIKKSLIKSANLSSSKYSPNDTLSMDFELFDDDAKNCYVQATIYVYVKEYGEYLFACPANIEKNHISLEFSNEDIKHIFTVGTKCYISLNVNDNTDYDNVTKYFEIVEKTDESKTDEDKKEVKLSFTDVKETDWFNNAVKYVYSNNIIKGYNDTTFAPNDNLTRGMLVTILYRMEGEQAINEKSKFPDVQNSKDYFYKAVIWTSKNNIIAGYNNGNFGPNDNITREQMAVILNKYAKFKGKDVSATNNLGAFSDVDKISDFATSQMKWAVGAGVITGNADKTLNPRGNATRAEVAAMMEKYCKKVGR